MSQKDRLERVENSWRGCVCVCVLKRVVNSLRVAPLGLRRPLLLRAVESTLLALPGSSNTVKDIEIVANAMTDDLVRARTRRLCTARVQKHRARAGSPAATDSSSPVSSVVPTPVKEPDTPLCGASPSPCLESPPREASDAADSLTAVVSSPERASPQLFADWDFEDRRATVIMPGGTKAVHRKLVPECPERGDASPVLALFDIDGVTVTAKVRSIWWQVHHLQNTHSGRPPFSRFSAHGCSEQSVDPRAWRLRREKKVTA